MVVNILEIASSDLPPEERSNALRVAVCEEAEKVALQCVRDWGLDRLDPPIPQDVGNVALAVHLIPKDGARGCGHFEEDTNTLYIFIMEEEASQCRKTFTIRHEMGHLYTEPLMGPDIPTWLRECAANVFAAHIQMPGPILERIARNASVALSIPWPSKLSAWIDAEVDHRFVSTLARTFNVSTETMFYRVINMGWISGIRPFEKHKGTWRRFATALEATPAIPRQQHCAKSTTASISTGLRPFPTETIRLEEEKEMNPMGEEFLECPTCQTPARRQDAKYCWDCGKPLHNICANSDCAQDLPTDSRFCDECGSTSLFSMNKIGPFYDEPRDEGTRDEEDEIPF